jgi:hypothetical protein
MSYSPTKPSASTRRTRIVWSVFIAAMTLTAGLLMLGDTGAPPMTMAVNPVRIGGEIRNQILLLDTEVFLQVGD